MAKDGTNRGGRRVRAGAKPEPLREKLAAGKPATRLAGPEVFEGPDLPATDIGEGAFQAPAVDHVAPSSAGGAAPDTSIDYNKLAPIDLIWHLEKRFEELRADSKVGEDYVAGSHGAGRRIAVPTWRCILNYLAKAYLRDGGSGSAVNWSVSAESFRSADASVLEKDAVGKKIIAALNRYIDNTWRQSMTDKTGESVDLAHLAATTLGYTNWNVIPDAWTGWAGDLATAMENIQKTLEWNPGANLDQVATALVGQGNDYRLFIIEGVVGV